MREDSDVSGTRELLQNDDLPDDYTQSVQRVSQFQRYAVALTGQGLQIARRIFRLQVSPALKRSPWPAFDRHDLG